MKLELKFLVRDGNSLFFLTNRPRANCIAIGLGPASFPLTGWEPGWRDGSYAYHSGTWSSITHF